MPILHRIERRLYKYTHRTTSLRFQIILSIITTIIISFLFYTSFTNIQFFDPKPELHFIKPQQFKDLQVTPILVKTGLFIHNFPVFDTVHNKFAIEGILWFEFNPSLISFNTIDKFEFDKGDITYKSKPIIRMQDHIAFVKYDIEAEFTSSLDYRFFPLDDHRLYIILVNKHTTPTELIMSSEQSYFNMADKIYTGGLKLLGKNVEYGYVQARLFENTKQAMVYNPVVIFSMDFKKSGIRKLLLIVLPIILMFFMSLFPLSLDPSSHASAILGLSLGSVSSMLAYRYVIESLSPSVGYFTLTDYLYTFILVCVFFNFLLSLLSIRGAQQLSYPFKVLRLIVIITLYISLIVYLYSLLYHFF